MKQAVPCQNPPSVTFSVSTFVYQNKSKEAENLPRKNTARGFTRTE